MFGHLLWVFVIAIVIAAVIAAIVARTVKKVNVFVVKTVIIAFTIITVAIIAGVIIGDLDIKGIVAAGASPVREVKINAILNTATRSDTLKIIGSDSVENKKIDSSGIFYGEESCRGK